MKKVGEMVAKLGKVALVWDDMLRTVPLSDIKVNRIDNLQPKNEFIKKCCGAVVIGSQILIAKYRAFFDRILRLVLWLSQWCGFMWKISTGFKHLPFLLFVKLGLGWHRRAKI